MGILTGCKPRGEVLRGDLGDTIFAADFGDVIDGTAPGVYQQASEFFRNTHPAGQLKKVAEVVFGALAKTDEPGAAIRLSTGFGGGKTHTLIALYHLAKNISNFSLGSELLPAAGRPSSVTTVAIDAGNAGVPNFARHGDLTVRSLWGEIRWRLGGAAALRDLGAADDPDASPSEAEILSALPPGPVLFLFDELVIYLGRLSETGQGNLLGLLNSLTAIAARRPQTMMIVTDPADQRAYGREAARVGQVLTDAATRLDEVLSRRVTDFNPIGNEAAKVIARRLFDTVSPTAAREASAAYYALYQRVSQDNPSLLPSAALTADYAQRFVECYPFHPRLLETAQDRLGALTDFQKSRGVLRLFARILRVVWDRQWDVDVISAGEIDWADPRIRGDLLQRLNRDSFAGAADADVGRHARDLDGGEVDGIHRRVAAAVLLESIPLQANSGLTASDATLAVLRPSDAGPEPSEALDRLVGICWHLYPASGGRGFHFRYEENISKQIEQRKGQFREDAVIRVRAMAQGHFGGPQFKLIAWPASAQQVPESRDLQLALCDSEEIASRVCRYGDEADPAAPMPRMFVNAIVAIAPTPSLLDDALDRAQSLLAAEAIKREQEVAAPRPGAPATPAGDANRLAREQLGKIVPEQLRQTRLRVFRAFDRVAVASGTYRMSTPLQIEDDKILQAPQAQPILRKFLEDSQLLYRDADTIDPDLFLTRILPGTTPLVDSPDAYTTKAVHERALSVAGLQLLPGKEIVARTLVKAVAAGKIVVRLSDGRAFDATGCVSGEYGKRRRAPGIPVIPLDDQTRIARTDSPTGQAWVCEDPEPAVGGTGGTTGVKDPDDTGGGWVPPPGPITIARGAAEAAAERPLLSLRLIAATPKAAETLTRLAVPLGPKTLSLDLSVSGRGSDGGDIVFQVSRVKLAHPLKPLMIGQAAYNAITDGRSYEAVLLLEYEGTGRDGLADALQTFEANLGADLTYQATFGPPARVAIA